MSKLTNIPKKGKYQSLWLYALVSVYLSLPLSELPGFISPEYICIELIHIELSR